MKSELIDNITLITLGLFLVSGIIFYWFGRFTLRLIRQHQDVQGLLYELEEQEKEKR